MLFLQFEAIFKGLFLAAQFAHFTQNKGKRNIIFHS